MYSLNVPVPGNVARVAATVAREIPQARARARGEHTLVVKRLTDDGAGARGDVPYRSHPQSHRTYNRLETRAREAVRGQPPFELRVDGIDYFEKPTSGPGPVVYLSVESRGLEALHDRLLEVFAPVDGLEGDAYVPHVTIARGGTREAARRLAQQDIDPITWTASELVFWDGERGQPVSRLSLPA